MLRRNILIFHNAALGDFVVTWPLAMACGRLMPQSRVIYVTAGQKGKLAEHVLGVESADIESGFSSLWREPSQLPAGAHKMLQGAALVISFGTAAGDAWSTAVSEIAPDAPVVHLSTKPPADYEKHVTQYIVDQLSPIQPAIAAAAQQMVDSLSRRGFGSRGTRTPSVLLHPGSGAERKNWPRARFIELAEALRRSGRLVRVVLGEVEREKWGPAVCAEFGAVGEVIGPQSLVELAQVMNGVGALVCNDSGPAHLAAALGLPTVAIFGPTSHPLHWRPAGPAVRVVNTPVLDELPADRVLAEVNAMLAASETAAEARSGKAPKSDE